MSDDLREYMKKALDIRKAREKEMDRERHKDFVSSQKAVEAQESALYDGVAGVLPDFPESFQREFKEIRNRLSKDYSHDELLGYIEEAERIIQTKREVDPNKSVYIRFQIPPDIDRDIFTLTGFKEADRLYKEVSRETGLAFLTDPKHANLVKKGKSYGKHQSKIGSNPRGKVTEDGKTLNELICNLATSSEHSEETATELWPHLFSELESLGLNPEEKEVAHESKDLYYWYTFKDKRKRITFGQFSNVVSKSRSKINSG